MTTLLDRETGVAKYHRELKGVRATVLAEIKYIVGLILGAFERWPKVNKSKVR